MVFHLPLRQTEGFLRCLTEMLEIDLPIHVGHMQKPPRNRAWRKLHLGVDAAYDTKVVYETAHERGERRAVRVLIPPGRNAQLSPSPSTALRERNRNIRSIRELGRREWHKRSGYSKRSMAENAGSSTR
jgi:hypothetical protein